MPAERSARVLRARARGVAQAADFRTTGALTEGVGDLCRLVPRDGGDDAWPVQSTWHATCSDW